MTILRTVLLRLKEPSTFAGIAAAAAGFGFMGFNEGDWNMIFGAVSAVAAAAAVFMRDPGSADS
jgi:hypothetical protein